MTVVAIIRSRGPVRGRSVHPNITCKYTKINIMLRDSDCYVHPNITCKYTKIKIMLMNSTQNYHLLIDWLIGA
jgi:pterin-4a-carbinolamine dehydratase